MTVDRRDSKSTPPALPQGGPPRTPAEGIEYAAKQAARDAARPIPDDDDQIKKRDILEPPDISRPTRDRYTAPDTLTHVDTVRGKNDTAGKRRSIIGSAWAGFRILTDPVSRAHRAADRAEAGVTHSSIDKRKKVIARGEALDQAGTMDLHEAGKGYNALMSAMGLRPIKFAKGSITQDDFRDAITSSSATVDPMKLVATAESGAVSSPTGAQLGMFLGPHLAKEEAVQKAVIGGLMRGVDSITREQDILASVGQTEDAYGRFIQQSELHRILRKQDLLTAERANPPIPTTEEDSQEAARLDRLAGVFKENVASYRTALSQIPKDEYSMLTMASRSITPESKAGLYADIAEAEFLLNVFLGIGESENVRFAFADLAGAVRRAQGLVGRNDSYKELDRVVTEISTSLAGTGDRPDFSAVNQAVRTALQDFPEEDRELYERVRDYRLKNLTIDNEDVIEGAITQAHPYKKAEEERQRAISALVDGREGLRRRFIDDVLVDREVNDLRDPHTSLRMLKIVAEDDDINTTVETSYARALLQRLQPDLVLSDEHALKISRVVAEALSPGRGGEKLKDRVDEGGLLYQKGTIERAGLKVGDILPEDARIFTVTAGLTGGLDTAPNGLGLPTNAFEPYVFSPQNRALPILQAAFAELQKVEKREQRMHLAPSATLAATILSNRSRNDVLIEQDALNRLSPQGIRIMKSTFDSVAAEAAKHVDTAPQLYQACAAMWVAGLEEALLAQGVAPIDMEVGAYTRVYAETTFDVLIAGLKEMKFKEDDENKARHESSIVAATMTERLAHILPPELASRLAVKLLTELKMVDTYIDTYMVSDNKGNQSQPEERRFERPVVLSREVVEIIQQLGYSVHNEGSQTDRVNFSRALGLTTSKLLRGLSTKPELLAQQNVGSTDSDTILSTLAELALSADPHVKLHGDGYIVPLSPLVPSMDVPIFFQSAQDLASEAMADAPGRIIGQQEFALTIAQAVLTPSYAASRTIGNQANELQGRAVEAKKKTAYLDRTTDQALRDSDVAQEVRRFAQQAQRGIDDISRNVARVADIRAVLDSWATQLLGNARLHSAVVNDHRGIALLVRQVDTLSTGYAERGQITVDTSPSHSLPRPAHDLEDDITFDDGDLTN